MDVGANELHPGPIARRSLPLVASAPENLGLSELCVCDELLGGPRLADARLTHQHEHPSATGERVFESRSQLVHFPLSTHENTTRQPIQGVRFVVSGMFPGRTRECGGNGRERLQHHCGTFRPILWCLGEQPHYQCFESLRYLGVVP